MGVGVRKGPTPRPGVLEIEGDYHQAVGMEDAALLPQLDLIGSLLVAQSVVSVISKGNQSKSVRLCATTPDSLFAPDKIFFSDNQSLYVIINHNRSFQFILIELFN